MITENDLALIGLDPKILIDIYRAVLRRTNSFGKACKAIEALALIDRVELPFTFGDLHEWAKERSGQEHLKIFGVSVHDGYLCQDCFDFQKDEIRYARILKAGEGIDCNECGQRADYIIFKRQ